MIGLPQPSNSSYDCMLPGGNGVKTEPLFMGQGSGFQRRMTSPMFSFKIG